MAKFRCEYVYSRSFGSARHSWNVIGRHGGVNLHISGPHVYDGRENWSAGLEFHYRVPPPGMADDAPSHDECWLLKCPCWHDGTSLYASEHYLPRWMTDPNDHERMFRALEREYEERIIVREDAA